MATVRIQGKTVVVNQVGKNLEFSGDGADTVYEKLEKIVSEHANLTRLSDGTVTVKREELAFDAAQMPGRSGEALFIEQLIRSSAAVHKS